MYFYFTLKQYDSIRERMMMMIAMMHGAYELQHFGIKMQNSYLFLQQCLFYTHKKYNNKVTKAYPVIFTVLFVLIKNKFITNINLVFPYIIRLIYGRYYKDNCRFIFFEKMFSVILLKNNISNSNK